MIVPFFDLGAEVSGRSAEILSAFSSVLESGQFIGGSVVEKFETEFASYNDAKFCAGVGNGLDAIRLILEALGIGPGDEVIVPNFTFYATWLAVMQVGARPVFVDVLLESATLNPELVEKKISPNTKAILVVHLFGIPAQMPEIGKVAKRYGIPIVEDCAQAHGAKVDGRFVGTFGIAGAFSFYPTKNLGALGDAGGVLTDSDDLYNFVKSRRSYGYGATKYDHVDFGWNTRLDPLQAAVLSQNLERLDFSNASRRRIASSYLDALGSKSNCVVGANAKESVWHHFVIRARDRSALRQFLFSNGVTTDIHYPYFDLGTPAVSKYLSRFNEHPASESENSVGARLSRSVVSLPMGPWMSDEQIGHVSQVLSRVPADVLG